MDVGGWLACFGLSTVGFCGFAFPSTATRENWPVNLHLASSFGQVTTAVSALTGIALAAHRGGIAAAFAIVFVSCVLSYAGLRYMGWYAQRAVMCGEILIAMAGLYVGSEWLWYRIAGH
jgi:hypothetical protein